MLRWYHEDGTPHLCDIEACESVANAMSLWDLNDDQVVIHFCVRHALAQLGAIDELCRSHHPIHYHVNL